MGRHKGDGLGRFGGRKAGTPNKEKPLKTFLREHSTNYFTPNIPEKDEKGRETGKLISQFDIDIRALDPESRTDAEIKILKFHTPQMQSTSVDMNIVEANKTLTERIALLASGSDIQAPDSE